MIAAGGTGGHLFPAQALAKHLKQNHPDIDILFIGGNLSTNPFFQKNNFVFKEISTSSFSLKKPWQIAKLLKGFFQSWKHISYFRPDYIIGFGSHYCMPVLAAALVKKSPYILHEQNSIPGKVNRLFSHSSTLTAITFPQSEQYFACKTKIVEFPMWNSHPAQSASEAKKYYGLDLEKKTLLIFGGSQGARYINQLLLQATPLLSKMPIAWQILHFTGKNADPAQYRIAYEKFNIPHVVKEFEERMDIAWQAADFAITRAGAASIAELIHFEVPSLLIPFPQATDDHQKHNGNYVKDKVRGAILKEQSDLNAEILCQLLSDLFVDPSLISQLQANITLYKKTITKEKLEKIILDVLYD